MNIFFPEGKDKAELIIREVKDVVEKELPVLEPDRVGIDGNICSAYNFLEKRWNAADGQIDHCRSHILVDRDNLTMALVANETDVRNKKIVRGKISLSRQYLAFGINDKDDWTPEGLGNFFRINRTYFDDKETNMSLVTLLKGFKAKIASTVEKVRTDSGSYTESYRQAVDSNLPDKFFINIPVFKGRVPEKIEVNIVAQVNGSDVTLALISADAAAIMENVRDKMIDDEIAKIRELAPEIPIIEV